MKLGITLTLTLTLSPLKEHTRSSTDTHTHTQGYMPEIPRIMYILYYTDYLIKIDENFLNVKRDEAATIDDHFQNKTRGTKPYSKI